jgi:hypothetical protein
MAGLNPKKELKNDLKDEDEDRDDIDVEDVDDEDEEEGSSSSGDKNKKIIIIAISVAAIVILFGVYMLMSNKSSGSEDLFLLNQQNTVEGEDVGEGGENPSIEDITEVDYGDSQLQPMQAPTQEPSEEPSGPSLPEGAVSPADIYDENGNAKGENAINPGQISGENNDNHTTDPRVYNSSDFIKDLNGADISAVYNVSEYQYVKDSISYVKRRAIMDDGMELYWLEAKYKGKPYRVTVPFYTWRTLDDSGICNVRVEVLILEGGGKVISHMEVLDEEDE